MNVLFDYMYRDLCNDKGCGEVIFGNPEGLALDVADARLREACVDNNNFTAAQVRVPDAFLFPFHNDDDDHAHHEFCRLKASAKDPTDPRTLTQFIEDFERESRKGWDARIPDSRLDHFGRLERDAQEARWRLEYATIKKAASAAAPAPTAKPSIKRGKQSGKAPRATPRTNRPSRNPRGMGR